MSRRFLLPLMVLVLTGAAAGQQPIQVFEDFHRPNVSSEYRVSDYTLLFGGDPSEIEGSSRLELLPASREPGEKVKGIEITSFDVRTDPEVGIFGISINSTGSVGNLRVYGYNGTAWEEFEVDRGSALPTVALSGQVSTVWIGKKSFLSGLSPGAGFPGLPSDSFTLLLILVSAVGLPLVSYFGWREWREHERKQRVESEIEEFDDELVEKVRQGELSAGHESLELVEKANESALHGDYRKAEDLLEKARKRV